MFFFDLFNAFGHEFYLSAISHTTAPFLLALVYRENLGNFSSKTSFLAVKPMAKIIPQGPNIANLLWCVKGGQIDDPPVGMKR